MAEVKYPIQLAARRTGLSAYVIRIWEQRYRAVEPHRTASNRRLYSQREIERLSLLRDLARAGHRIGQLARLPDQQLRRLAAKLPGTEPAAPRTASAVPGDALLESECIAAIQSLDAQALRAALERASVALGVQGMIQRVVGPLAQTTGDLWREGASPRLRNILPPAFSARCWRDCPNPSA